MNRLLNLIRIPALTAGILFSVSAHAGESDSMAGVYIGEQPGAYLQNRLSRKTAMMFSASAINQDYWLNADFKYYLGDYADSVYFASGLTYAKQAGLPSETVYRAGGGLEAHGEGGVVYGIGATLWWGQSWVEPIVRGGIYIAYYR